MAMVSLPPLTPSSACQVRCAGCRGILNVPAGVLEFRCPKCKLPQMLPPELRPPPHLAAQIPLHLAPPNPPPPLPHPHPPPHHHNHHHQHLPDPTLKAQLPCANCRTLLNVPHGLERFICPQCHVELAVDLTKLQHYLSSLGASNIHKDILPAPGPATPMVEEINEVGAGALLFAVFIISGEGNVSSFLLFN